MPLQKLCASLSRAAANTCCSSIQRASRQSWLRLLVQLECATSLMPKQRFYFRLARLLQRAAALLLLFSCSRQAFILRCLLCCWLFTFVAMQITLLPFASLAALVRINQFRKVQIKHSDLILCFYLCAYIFMCVCAYGWGDVAYVNKLVRLPYLWIVVAALKISLQ